MHIRTRPTSGSKVIPMSWRRHQVKSTGCLAAELSLVPTRATRGLLGPPRSLLEGDVRPLSARRVLLFDCDVNVATEKKGQPPEVVD